MLTLSLFTLLIGQASTPAALLHRGANVCTFVLYLYIIQYMHEFLSACGGKDVVLRHGCLRKIRSFVSTIYLHLPCEAHKESLWSLPVRLRVHPVLSIPWPWSRHLSRFSSPPTPAPVREGARTCAACFVGNARRALNHFFDSFSSCWQPRRFTCP